MKNYRAARLNKKAERKISEHEASVAGGNIPLQDGGRGCSGREELQHKTYITLGETAYHNPVKRLGDVSLYTDNPAGGSKRLDY